MATGIKKYKSIIKKKKKKHDKVVLLAKTKLNSIEVLISNALTDSQISHDEFVSVNIVLSEYDDIKEEIKYLKTSTRGGPRTTATSKMEHFVMIVNGWKPITVVTKSSILDVAVVPDPPLSTVHQRF